MDTFFNSRGYPLTRELTVISPGLMFVQKGVLLGLFFGEAYFRRVLEGFCISKWVGLSNKNSLNTTKTT